MNPDYFIPTIFVFLFVVWIFRIIFSKNKEKVFKEGAVKLSYDDGRTTRDISKKELLILVAVIVIGISIIIYFLP